MTCSFGEVRDMRRHLTGRENDEKKQLRKKTNRKKIFVLIKSPRSKWRINRPMLKPDVVLIFEISSHALVSPIHLQLHFKLMKFDESMHL